MAGQTKGVQERLQAAELAWQNFEPASNAMDWPEVRIRDQIGQIGCARATLALTRYDPDEMILQAQRARENLHPDNLVFRFTAEWALASASLLKGDRKTAAQAGMEALAISQKSGDIFSNVLALTDLGMLQEFNNQLHQAAETYQQLLPLISEHPLPNAAEIYLGLARIYYEWNDLEAAEQYGQQSLQLARQYDQVIDRFIISEVFLARVKFAKGDVDGAATLLKQVEQSARQQNFLLRMPEIARVQVLITLRQGKLGAATELAKQHELPRSQARVYLAQKKPSAALAILEPLQQEFAVKEWQDEWLKTRVFQAVVYDAHGKSEDALRLLDEVLAFAESDGFVRIFLDEGTHMAALITKAMAQGLRPDTTAKLLSAFEAEGLAWDGITGSHMDQSLIEPLSPRELEVLQLIAKGMSNQEISERLFLALSTVKGHNQKIYTKLQVQRRTEAVVRARELGLV
jgi:LuxR family maltose regulon positive regulatory protein